MAAINSSTPNAQKGPGERLSVFSALRHRDFRLLWLGQIVSVTGSQMQLFAVNWHVYLLTKSAFAVGLVGLFRGGPIILCSLVGGVVADAVDRKRLMIVTQSVMLVSATCLMAVTLAGLSHVWPIYLLTAIASAASAFDTPARQSLMPSLVPTHDFANAVSLGVVVFYIAMISGPALAGFVLAGHGPAVVYGINAGSFLAVIAALVAMHVGGRVVAQNELASRVSLAALKEGLQFVRQTPIIVQTMTLDFAATFFASATALLPIFAIKILNVGAHGYGLLGAAPAVGAVITGLVMARIGTFRRQGKLVIWSVAIFGLATIAFGLSRVFWLSLLMLGLTGAADTVSTVLRQTIRQLATPDHLRGRMTSVNMVFFMGGPQLGEVEAGAVASLIGAPLSVVTGGVGCVVSALIALLKARRTMTDHWQPKETSTHQDHVIAHVLGATVLGYFVFDEALHVLLDIGLVWTIYVDGQMMLLPQVVATGELETDAATRSELNREIELLGHEGRLAEGLERITPAPVECLMSEVQFFEDGDRRRLILCGEEANLVIETSLETAEIRVIADDR